MVQISKRAVLFVANILRRQTWQKILKDSVQVAVENGVPWEKKWLARPRSGAYGRLPEPMLAKLPLTNDQCQNRQHGVQLPEPLPELVQQRPFLPN
ncbi:MAG: hypothetical protein DHS20C20_06070 [Ardenticatenaceae bacterium]|nr:MAG: hypothetical protein DHS20C20_06070 [Ardenticatenaceae bacterium]